MIFLFPRWNMLIPWRVTFKNTQRNLCDLRFGICYRACSAYSRKKPPPKNPRTIPMTWWGGPWKLEGMMRWPKFLWHVFSMMGGMGWDGMMRNFLLGRNLLLRSMLFFSKKKHGSFWGSVESWLVVDGFKMLHLFLNPCFKTRGGSIKISHFNGG